MFQEEEMYKPRQTLSIQISLAHIYFLVSHFFLLHLEKRKVSPVPDCWS